MSLPADIHFLRPLALLLILALPLSLIMLRGARRDGRAWRNAVDPHLLPHLLEGGDARRGRAPWWFGSLAWIVACVALAGPAWERESMPLHRNQHARVIVLELSPTMLAQDEKPSRLARARFRIHDILERSRDRQTALVAYGGDAFVVAPLTDDIATVGNLVDSLDPSMMPVAGNATGRGIDKAVALVQQAGLHHGEIVLMADSVDADAIGAARRARQAGLVVSVLGAGTTAGAPVPLPQGDFLKDAHGNVVLARLDESDLAAVARAGGGRYATLGADDASSLDAVLDGGVALDSASRAEDGALAGTRWLDRGPWLVLALLPLVLFGFRRGWLLVVALALFAPMPQAQAASLADLWKRRDQQTADALRDGDAARAGELAPTQEWKAAAAYRGGDFEAAAEAYAGIEGPDAAYNRGNALAKLGRYEDAIEAYDEALRLAPDMQDATANRAAVEAALKRQEQNRQQQPDPQGSPDRQDRQSGKDPSQDDRQPESDDASQSQENGERQNGDQRDDTSPEPNNDAAGSDDKSGEPQDDASDAREDGRQSGNDADESSASGSEDRDGKPSDAQQEAFKREMDEAMQERAEQAAEPGDPGSREEKGAARMSAEEEGARERDQAQEQWLQRVPDDPGGLLRRKFQLEYQRRKQDGGDDR